MIVPLIRNLNLLRLIPSLISFIIGYTLVNNYILKFQVLLETNEYLRLFGKEVLVVNNNNNNKPFFVSSSPRNIINNSKSLLDFGDWNKIEKESREDYNQNKNNQNTSKILYIITPTYKRTLNLQQAELLSVAQSLYLAKSFVKWIIILDIDSNNIQDQQILYNLLVPLFDEGQLNITIEFSEKILKPIKSGKGIPGRRTGLRLILNNNSTKEEGGRINGQDLIYFADDDNTYDFELYSEIRKTTSNVSVWPVGALTNLGVGTPLINNGKIVQVLDGWISRRKYPLDFASFVVNLKLVKQEFKKNKDLIKPTTYSGRIEDTFLKSLKIPLKDFQPLAYNCTRIFVWHTKQSGNVGYYIPLHELPRETPIQEINGLQSYLEALNNLLHI